MGAKRKKEAHILFCGILCFAAGVNFNDGVRKQHTQSGIQVDHLQGLPSITGLNA